MKNWVILAIAAGVAYYLWKTASTFYNLLFVPRGISFSGGGIQLVIGMQNTSSMPVQLNSFAGTLLVNGSPYGNVTSFQPAIINPNAETDVPVTISPNIISLADTLLNALQGGSIPSGYSVELQGTANVSGQQIPVDVKF